MKLLFLILIYNTLAQNAVYKALDVFKRNQWTLNKQFKSNQAKAKIRTDELEEYILKQATLIRQLTVCTGSRTGSCEEIYFKEKLDAVESKATVAVSQFDDLKSKVTKLENKLGKLD